MPRSHSPHQQSEAQQEQGQEQQNQRMVAVDCQEGIDRYMDKTLYFHSVSWGFQPITYLGLCAENAVRAIGRIHRIVDIIFDFNHLSQKDTSNPEQILLSIQNLEGFEVTLSEIELQRVIYFLPSQINVASKTITTQLDRFDHQQPYRFYFVDQFYATEFKSTSPDRMAFRQYFDLQDYLGTPLPSSTEQIANLLNGMVWS